MSRTMYSVSKYLKSGNSGGGFSGHAVSEPQSASISSLTCACLSFRLVGTKASGLNGRPFFLFGCHGS